MNEPTFDDPEPVSPVPRLGIVHIMLWTALSATQVTVLRWIYSLQDWPEDVAVMQRASGVVNAIIVGAQLTGAIVLVHARLRGRTTRLLTQPGHWLLMIQGTFALLSICMYTLITVLLVGMNESPVSNIFMVFYGMLFLGTTLAYVIAACFTRQWRWKAAFLAIAVLAALQGATYLIAMAFSMYLYASSTMMAAYGRIAVSIWIIGLAGWDIARSERRDWLHWAGIAAYLAGIYATVFQILLQWLGGM